MIKIKTIIRGIKNLWFWVPIIWHDRQYDESFLFRILGAKLKLMENYFDSEHIVIADAKSVASTLRTCRILCERLCDQEYLIMLDLVHHADNFEDFIYKLNAGQETITCKTIGYIDERWLDYEDHMKKQDIKLLCKLIKKHAFEWWE